MAKRKNPAYVESALKGHNRSARDGAEEQDSPSQRRGAVTSGTAGPNIEFHGKDHKHEGVKTGAGSSHSEPKRQFRNAYGPNIQFHGADHQHEGVKTTGGVNVDRPGASRKAPAGQRAGFKGPSEQSA